MNRNEPPLRKGDHNLENILHSESNVILYRRELHPSEECVSQACGLGSGAHCHAYWYRYDWDQEKGDWNKGRFFGRKRPLLTLPELETARAELQFFQQKAYDAVRQADVETVKDLLRRLDGDDAETDEIRTTARALYDTWMEWHEQGTKSRYQALSAKMFAGSPLLAEEKSWLDWYADYALAKQ